MSSIRDLGGSSALFLRLLVSSCVALAQVANAHSDEGISICHWEKQGPLQGTDKFSRCNLPLDDTTGDTPSHWKPWSVRPICAYPFVNTEPKYCIFTYHGFRGDRSISLITSPDVAAEAAPLLEDRNPQWYKTSPSVPPLDGDFTPPYSVEEVPGRGKGIIATRDIRKGEVVITEPATMISMTPPRGIRPKQLTILSQTVLEQLPDVRRKRVLEMASMPDLDPLWGRFDTNAFGVFLTGENEHRGLFPEIAASVCINASRLI